MLDTHVINAVATADGVDSSDLDPLYEYIDPDVLTQLADQDGAEWSLTFQYTDHQVTVNHEGRILVDGKVYASDILAE